MRIAPPVPPRESITPRPRKVIEELQEFQNVQYNEIMKIQNTLNSQVSSTDEDDKIAELLESQIEAYNKMHDFIDTL